MMLMMLESRVHLALRELCKRARASGVDPSPLVRSLLGVAARYAQSAGWSLTRARAELSEQWKSVVPGARCNEPGDVVEKPERESDE